MCHEYCISFLGWLQQRTTRYGLKNKKKYFLTVLMLKFKIKVSTGLSPSEGYEGESVTCFLRSSYWFADKSLAFLVFAATP